jgi:hypothetical protein
MRTGFFSKKAIFQKTIQARSSASKPTLIWGEHPIDRRGDFTYYRTVRDEIFFQKRNSDSVLPPAPTTDIRTK